MSSKINRILLYAIAPLISGTLLFLAFPPYGLPFLIWVGLVPIMLVIYQKGFVQAFLISGLGGLVYFAGFFNWILVIPGYTLLHHAILDVFLAIFFGTFGLVFSLISRRFGATMAFSAAPFIWVSLEYLRSNLLFMALPMGLLAHSQYANPSIIQISSLAGAYGVSFLVVMVNSAIAGLILSQVYRVKKGASLSPSSFSRHGANALIAAAALLTIFTLIYGRTTISQPIDGESFKLSLVQGNIEQSQKWNPKYANFIINTYARMTEEAAEHKPSLIIWPEGATPRSIARDQKIRHQVDHIAKSAGTYLLMGSTQHQKFKQEGIKKVEYFNSAFLIPPIPDFKNQRYDKVRLFPFGEYLPMKETIPWSFINIPDRDNYSSGNEFKVFEIPDLRFGVTICWENLFPELVRRFVINGAQLIVNITNEAWFGRTAAPYHFVSTSVFRSVENRIYVVRCANTGISCFIDPFGRIVKKVKDASGHDISVRGVLTGEITSQKYKTIYNRYGNWLIWLSMAFTTSLISGVFFKRIPRLPLAQSRSDKQL